MPGEILAQTSLLVSTRQKSWFEFHYPFSRSGVRWFLLTWTTNEKVVLQPVSQSISYFDFKPS